MEPNVFLGYLIRGIVGVLNSFAHEQYPSNKVNPWCLITEYPNEGIGFLVGSRRATKYPSMFQRYVLKPNVFLGYLKRGIACSLSPFRYEQDASNSLNQNNSAHGVYNVPR
jgi:hypothetical protein